MGYYTDYYRAEVQQVSRLSPNMLRIRFGGEDLSRFTSSGDPDERLVVVLPDGSQRHTRAPIRIADGTLGYPDSQYQPEIRSYTVRRWSSDEATMEIDFVRHRGGVAAAWAQRAEPGDVVYLSPAKGWYACPADAEWLLLATDMTGLPALGRILDEIPAGSRALVIAEVIDPADRQRLTSAADLEIEWLVGSGHGMCASRLPDAIRTRQLPDGPGYAWFAGEAADSRAVRKHVRRELGWPVDRYTILGYWRAQAEAWLARYERVGADLEAVYERALADGRSEGDALEIYDDALERAGL